MEKMDFVAGQVPTEVKEETQPGNAVELTHAKFNYWHMGGNQVSGLGIRGKQAEDNLETIRVQMAEGVQEHHIGAGGALRVDNGEDLNFFVACCYDIGSGWFIKGNRFLKPSDRGGLMFLPSAGSEAV